MKRIISAYKEIIAIIYSQRPFVVLSCIFIALLSGAINPLLVWVSEEVFNRGIDVALGKLTLEAYIPILILFLMCMLLPQVFTLFQNLYIWPNSRLIIKTAYKGKMLQKLQLLKYEHFESEASMEIIDKAYSRAEEAALHLFPSGFYSLLFSIVSIGGVLYLFAKVRWWLLFTILIPFIIDTYTTYLNKFNIYEEMDSYWNRERQYSIIGKMLRSREYMKESRLFQSANHIIETYRKRLHQRNREFEKFYFMYLKKHFISQNIAKIAQIGNALLLLWIYIQGHMNIGQLIALTISVFTSLYSSLGRFVNVFRWMGNHMKAYMYYDRYFALSENTYGEIDEIPKDTSIDFIDVCFTYPQTERRILNHISFHVDNGEKVSLVGKNGEGKSTIIKLLLGLFQPDSGTILIGGQPISSFSQTVRKKLFGPIFQDFMRYSMTLRENIGIGEIDKCYDMNALEIAIHKARVDTFLHALPQRENTVLNRDFDDGFDLSGGQWQRVAIARAFMGNKPILILDEPTSQLDPLAESEIYADFAQISTGKTALLVTHRLGSTTITDRILVVNDGVIAETGTHDELMQRQGLYAEMFLTQRQWYVQNEEATLHE